MSPSLTSSKWCTMLSMVVLIALSLTSLAKADEFGQLFQPSTLDVQLVNCDFETIFEDTDFGFCPNRTCHVVIQRVIPWVPAEEGVLYNVNFSIGCCPNTTFGVFDTTDNILYGCCGPSDLDPIPPVPCFNSQRQMVGCTNYASRCCDEQICGKNYVCCGGQCCPALGLAPYNLNASCALVDRVDPLTGRTASVYSGCIAPESLFVCEPTNIYNVSCPPVNFSAPDGYYCPLCPYPNTTCLFPPQNNSFLQLPCGSSSECVRYDLIINNCSGIILNCTDGVSPIDLPVGCSATSNHSDTCVYTSAGPYPILVGDRAPNETCCGPFICSLGMRCCSLTFETVNLFNTTYNTTEYYGCCPDVPEIECCYNNILNVLDTRKPANFFCGAQYNATSCQVDKLRPALYFAMAQIARNFSSV
jgi:hypothetical protein